MSILEMSHSHTMRKKGGRPRKEYLGECIVRVVVIIFTFFLLLVVLWLHWAFLLDVL